MGKKTRFVAVMAAAVGVNLAGVSLWAQNHGQDQKADRWEEAVPGKPDLVKVTHIFRNQKGKGRSGPACSCPGSDGSNYSLEKVKWFNPIDYTLYTAGSGLGSAVGVAIANSFSVWRVAEPNAPEIRPTQNDADPAPGIALDAVQAVTWAPISALYGSDTLAVTVYWYTRAKIGGFSKVVHFDMAFNTDYSWSLLGAAESCGAGGAFDVRNVATHEAGHVYGTAHNNDCNLTMNPTAAGGETIKSSLAPGDQKGIQAIY